MQRTGLISTVFSDNEAFLYSDDKLAYYANILSINGAPCTMNRLRNIAGKYITYKVIQKNYGGADISIDVRTQPALKRRGRSLFR